MDIPFIKPKFPEPEALAADLKRIYDNNYYSNNGPVYFEFRRALELYLGQDLKAVVVSNATLGLMLALQAAIKAKRPGKKYVAIPSFTFAAGPLAIRWCGFEPLFFDIDPLSTQPGRQSFEQLLAAYGDDLAGVLLINSFGIGNKEIDAWETLLAGRNLPFIIDSAPGFGSTYADGTLLGARGSCEVFSFHATKPFGIGEGGLVTTRDAGLADELESLKNFGFDANKQTVGPGINAKITELDCAIGLRVLSHYPETLADRRTTQARYEKKLRPAGVSFLPRAESAAIQFATIIVKPAQRSKIIRNLKRAGIEARTYYAPAVHTFPFFADVPSVDLSNTETLSEQVISLPVHPRMRDADIDRICDSIIATIAESRNAV